MHAQYFQFNRNSSVEMWRISNLVACLLSVRALQRGVANSLLFSISFSGSNDIRIFYFKLLRRIMNYANNTEREMNRMFWLLLPPLPSNADCCQGLFVYRWCNFTAPLWIFHIFIPFHLLNFVCLFAFLIGFTSFCAAHGLCRLWNEKKNIVAK